MALSLKEMMAAKKAAATQATSEVQAVQKNADDEILNELNAIGPATTEIVKVGDAPIISNPSAETPVVVTQEQTATQPEIKQVINTPATVVAEAKPIVQQAIKPVVSGAESVDAQLYADMQARINALKDLDTEDLTQAMKDLKRALSENPAACALMLPEDLGQMVAALRRIVGEDIAEASKPAKERKTKAKALTAEELAAAFDEL